MIYARHPPTQNHRIGEAEPNLNNSHLANSMG